MENDKVQQHHHETGPQDGEITRQNYALFEGIWGSNIDPRSSGVSVRMANPGMKVYIPALNKL